LETETVQQRVKALKERFKGIKVMLGIDRLDYIKGVPHKLLAFDAFLQAHPEWQGRVVLMQVAVPTRQEVEEYQNLRVTVNELVGRINGRYGTAEYTPVHYLYRSIAFDELVALYRLADCCVVSSTRDGMNLVSYEWIACQHGSHEPGVLILSEFAGAAQSLNGALIVNPWNIDDLAESFHEALLTPPDLASQNHVKLLRYVQKYSASFWGVSFVEELKKSCSEKGSKQAAEIKKIDSLKEVSRGKPVYLIHWDGLIRSRIATGRLVDVLDKLEQVWIVSSSSRSELSANFKDGFGLIAEHGAFIKRPRTSEWTCHVASEALSQTKDGRSFSPSWCASVMPIIEHYTEQTPGSRLLVSESMLGWKFEEADPEFGRWQASELHLGLEKLASHLAIECVLGRGVLEIRSSSLDRSSLANVMGPEEQEGTVVLLGDVEADEPLFELAKRLFKDRVVGITVGKRRQTAAQYFVDSPSDAYLLLADLVAHS